MCQIIYRRSQVLYLYKLDLVLSFFWVDQRPCCKLCTTWATHGPPMRDCDCLGRVDLVDHVTTALELSIPARDSTLMLGLVGVLVRTL